MLSSLRVLIVDDYHDAADSLGLLLGLWGYQTAVVYDGSEALTVAPSLAPHVVLLDVSMPGMCGAAVAARLRRPGGPPVLVATTAHDLDDARMSPHNGLFDHRLGMPYDLDRLKRLLAECATTITT